MTPKRLVVVGGVAAGMSAAAKARRTDPNLEITVYEKTGYVSYGSCGFPYYIAGVFDDDEHLIARTPEAFARDGIETRLHHQVLSIDAKRNTLAVQDLASGRVFEDRYDRLVLTTGGSAVRPSLPGLDLAGVFTLRTVEDAKAIRDWLRWEKPRHGVVVGAGYIGLEMAEALAAHGVQVNVVEMLAQPMPNVDAEIAGLVADELERQSVGVYLNRKVERFVDGDAQGHVSHVVAGSETFPAGIVILAAGIRPNVALAEQAGIALGPTGAVAVDDHQRTSIPGIYAAGDVAEACDVVTGQPTWVPLATTANKQGKVAGENAAGGNARFGGIVSTAVVKVFDLEVARTGLTEAEARTHGFDAATTVIRHDSRSGYYPGAAPITLKLVFDRATGRLLGAQMAGRDGVSKRIDVLAAALHGHWTVAQVADLDLAYAPPFSPTWDITLIAASQALKKVRRG